MRLLVGFFLAAAGLTGVGFPGTGEIVPVASADSQPSPTRFELTLVGETGTCRIERNDGGNGSLSGVKLGQGCLRMYPALGEAKFWRERGDGSLVLADDDGKSVVVFGPSDGLAFESIEPASPLIMLSSAD